MERLELLKERMVSCIEGQMGNLEAVDAKELGEAIDMVKDLEEAMYYCAVVKAMKKRDEEEQYTKYYPDRRMPYDYYRDIDRGTGKIYDDRQGQMQRGSMNKQPQNWQSEDESYGEDMYPVHIRDTREGKSPMSRKHYMESKEMHQDSKTQMMELEKYLAALSKDVTEMIEDATPEEKQVLRQKMQTLIDKI